MRRILSTAVAIMALAVMVPGLSHADVMQPDCIFDPNDGGDPPVWRAIAVGDSCSTGFEITSAEANHHVSLVGSHAGFHAFPGAGGFGRVALQWKDSDGAVLAEWNCLAMGARADGEHERLLRPTCSEIVAPPSPLPVGNHTLIATVTELQQAPVTGTRLHGRLVIRDDLPL